MSASDATTPRYADAAWWEPPDKAAFSRDECVRILEAAGPWVPCPTDEDWPNSPTYEVATLDMASSEKQALLARLAKFAEVASENGGWGVRFDGTMWMQLLRYRNGAQIRWHYDKVRGHPVFSRTSMAVSVQLSDPAGYEGGALEVKIRGRIHRLPAAQGSVTAYTISCRHRATPVTAGERLVLVAFISDPQTILAQWRKR